MRRRYVGVIVDALGILQHGCRGHDTGDRAPNVSPRPRTSRRSGSRVRKSTPPAAGTSAVTGAALSHRSEGSMIRALMDLALPRFADSGNRPIQLNRS